MGNWEDLPSGRLDVTANEADIFVSEVAVTPLEIQPGENFSSVIFTYGNNGINDLSGNEIKFSMYISRNSTWDGSANYIGGFVIADTTTSGQTQSDVGFSQSALQNFTISRNASGYYYVFLRIQHNSVSSPLVDPNTSNNIIVAPNRINVKIPPLDAPENVQASYGTYTDKVRITWDSVSEATHYKVYWDVTDTPNPIPISGWQSSRTYDDISVTKGCDSYYWIQAASSSDGDRCSDYSSPAAIGWIKLLPPNVTATKGTYNDKVIVSCNDIGVVYQYKFFYSSSSGGSKSLLRGWDYSNSCDHYTSDTATYYYWVKAKPRAGEHESVYSDYDTGYITRINTHDLTVQSQNPNSGVNITVSPLDNNDSGSGNTTFDRTYNDNIDVTLTAPSTVSGNDFSHWLLDDENQGSSRTLQVTMTANHTAEAIYTPSNVPEIDTYAGSTHIPDGGSVDFGNVSGANTITKTFTIKNTGSATLNLTGNPLVDITGSGSGYFTVTDQPGSSISASAQDTFTVQFDPPDTGNSTASAEIIIANNDGNENPYNINISGSWSNAGDPVSYSPDLPVKGQSCTITYDSSTRNLSTADPVYIHLGYNNWQGSSTPLGDFLMTGSLGSTWSHTFFVSNNWDQIDCVFTDLSGQWDNNDSNDWHKTTMANTSSDTISRARAKGNNVNVTIGPITIYTTNDMGGTTYICAAQDSTGGIALFDTAAFDLIHNNGLIPGDSVTISGKNAWFRGLYELKDIALITKHGNVGVPTPINISISDLQDNASNAEKYESQLVKITDVTFSDSGTFSDGTNYSINKNSQSATVRIQDSNDPLVGTTIPNGACTITGMLGQYGSSNDYVGTTVGYQLLPLKIDFVTDNPSIGCAPSSLNPTCIEGNNASSDLILVYNAGNGTLSYNISESCSWISSINPSSGSSTGGYNNIYHTVTYNTSELSPSNYSCIITISSGNADNSPQTIDVNLNVELSPPTVISFSINNDDSSTSSRNVTLNNSCSGSPTHYMASESSSLSGGSWSNYSIAPPFTLSPGNGTKAVFFKVKNSAGESTRKYDTITLNEITPLTVNSLSINNGDSSTSSRNVILNNSCSGSPTHYIASESSSFSGASWLAYSNAPSFTLSSGDGEKTVYFKIKNSAGESTSENCTITLSDTSSPTPDPMTWAIEPHVVGQGSISMIATTATDPSGVEYYFQRTTGPIGNYDSGWQDSPTYTLTELDVGVYGFIVKARDKSANQNTTGYSSISSVIIAPKRIQVSGNIIRKDKRRCDIVKGINISPELASYFEINWLIGIATNTIDATFDGPYWMLPNRNRKKWKYKSKSPKIQIKYINGKKKSKFLYKCPSIPSDYIIFIEEQE